MDILLMCRHAHGSAAFPAKVIEGHHAPARRYAIEEYQVVLSGHAPAILHHDADELLAVPGGLYRMPTAKEQERWQRAQRAKTKIEE